MTILVSEGETFSLSVQLASRETNKFPLARLYADGIPYSFPVALSHISDGFYSATASAVVGVYDVVIEIYNDAIHTILSDYQPSTETVVVEDWADTANAVLSADVNSNLNPGTVGEMLASLAGEVGLHVRDDALAYDTNDRPLSFRRRIFPDAATAASSTPGGTGEGEIITINVNATHSSASRWSTLLRTRA